MMIKPSTATPGAFHVEGMPKHDDAFLVGYLVGALRELTRAATNIRIIDEPHELDVALRAARTALRMVDEHGR